MDKQGGMMIDKYDELIFTPSQAANAGLNAARKAQEQRHRGIPLGIPSMDNHFLPVVPGQLCVILAQTSHGKSWMMDYIIRNTAEFLVAQGRTDEIIVKVSMEDTIEEMAFRELGVYAKIPARDFSLGNIQDWDRVRKASITISGIPVFRMGQSLAMDYSARELLYVSNMIKAIDYLRNEMLGKPMKIAALFFDYIQLFPIDPTRQKAQPDRQRRLQVDDDLQRLRTSASYFDCPVYVNAQAKQELRGNVPPYNIPGVYDGKETSTLATTPDKILATWMPCSDSKTPVGTIIRDPNSGLSFKVEDNLMFLKCLKQRGNAPKGKTVPLKLNYLTHEIVCLNKKSLCLKELP